MIIRKSDLKLVPFNHPQLTTAPLPFDFNGEVDADMFANLMIDRMRELGGVGLSANQVGVNSKMFVMGIGEVTYAIFNPEIVETNSEILSADEGCLSFPGIYMKVARPKSVTVRYQNAKGETVTEEFTGLTARIFLHEYDHMEGMTFKDKVSKLKWDLAYNRMVKRTKKIVRKGVQRQLMNIQQQMEEKNVDNSSRVS